MALIGGLKMNVFEDMILSELISRLDDEDNPKVYHREIYGQRYAMSIPLKQAGDSLMRKSLGWVMRKFDKVKLLHYTQLIDC